MNLEQTEAHIAEVMRLAQMVGIYHLRDSTLRELVALAWSAGRNYGFKECGQYAVDTFDAALLTNLTERN